MHMSMCIRVSASPTELSQKSRSHERTAELLSIVFFLASTPHLPGLSSNVDTPIDSWASLLRTRSRMASEVLSLGPERHL